MGQLEDLQRNRLARMQHIQKGFCGDDTEGDIVKAHNVGDVHPNHPDWVWTQLPNGKYDWRVRKGQAKPAPAPAPQPKSDEPDFTPKIPSEITRLTNRSDWGDFDDAYRTLGAEIFKEKFPTAADFQKWVKDNPYKGIKTQQEMERHLGREEAGDIGGYRSQPLSKTAQIAAMKKYYEDRAVRAKKAYQEKKNADYWAGAGAQRKAEILKRRDELKDKIKGSIDEVKSNVAALVSAAVSDITSKSKKVPVSVDFVINYNDERITIQEMTQTSNRFNSGIEITITHGDFWAKPGDKGYDDVGYAEVNISSMRTKQTDTADWEHEQNKLLVATATMSKINDIKKQIVKNVKDVRAARAEMEELVKEMTQNH